MPKRRKPIDRQKTYRLPVSMDPTDKAHLEALAIHWNCSAAEVVRRSVRAMAEVIGD